MPNPTGKGGWVKGQSGNPAGRKPNTDSLADVLRALGERPHPRGGTYHERVMTVAWEQAAQGDQPARAWLVDRIYGKVASSELEGRLAELEALVTELLRGRTGATNGSATRTLAESGR